jgi:hypothetical protein
MYIEIQTTAQLSKSMSIKREKEGDVKVLVAHLKFDGALIHRETIDELVGQPIGWSQSCLFDEQGAPIGHIEIALPKLVAQVTGKIRGVDADDHITLAQAFMDGVTISLSGLINNQALLSGSLAWKVAGDEASDLEPLLGRLCALHWVIQDGGQQDMLKAARGWPPKNAPPPKPCTAHWR